jgi:Holliday junction resolvase RusA-like endonuclease
MVQTFRIDGRLMGLNEYVNACRSHWSQANRAKAENDEIVFWAIKQAHLKPIVGAFDMSVEWHEELRGTKHRDVDNIRFGVKFILDALQEAGVIGNDGWREVRSITDSFYEAPKGKGQIIVLLENR